MANPKGAHPFALSQKSIRLNRDTFIFRPDSDARLLAGLCQRVTKATPNQLRLWFKLLYPNMRDVYELDEVMVHRARVFRYVMKRTRNRISWDAEEPLPPGYYALWPSEGLEAEEPHHFLGAGPVDSYAQQIRKIIQKPDAYVPNALELDSQTSFKKIAKQRDQMTCLITGKYCTAEEVDVSWIVQPAFMDQYLIQQFKQQDDFRIVIFGNMDDSTRRILEDARTADRLREDCDSGGENAPKRCFLLAHFRSCLCSHFLGGDVRDEYDHSSDMIMRIIQRAQRARDDDPFCDTIPGREYRAAQEIEYEGEEEDSDEGIGSDDQPEFV
ncbi:hypothetical protein CPC08DRAFT_818453 [Agrocybe pediades]|nr:hypothetical protein CPC08DRAFT_818453 [Agrocybe pediades]